MKCLDSRSEVKGLGWARAALALGLAGLITACGAREPALAELPQGVSRDARPEIIIKGEDVYWNGHLIRKGKTLGSEVEAWLGENISSLEGTNRFFSKTGIWIAAKPDAFLPDKPITVYVIQVWLNQETDYGKSRTCTESEIRAHQASVNERLVGMAKEEQEQGWQSREKEKAELRKEVCSMPGKSPDTTFTGYLEVDGMPVGPSMNLNEVQARRKALGLLPLRVNSASGSPWYFAPRAKNEPWAYQQWKFVFRETEADAGTQPLVWISVP